MSRSLRVGGQLALLSFIISLVMVSSHIIDRVSQTNSPPEYEDEKTGLVVSHVLSVLRYYEELARSGVKTTSETQEAALAYLNSLEQSEESFFYVFDAELTFFVQPHGTVGQNDPPQIQLRKHGESGMQALKTFLRENDFDTKSDAWIEATSGQEAEVKIYVKYFKPWRWYIGSTTRGKELTVKIEKGDWLGKDELLVILILIVTSCYWALRTFCLPIVLFKNLFEQHSDQKQAAAKKTETQGK